MAIAEPTGPLWQAVQARRPDLWPQDDEQTAAELATTLHGVADSAQQMHAGAARGGELSQPAWTDDVGNALRDKLSRHATMTQDLIGHVRQRAGGAQAYSGELTGAKSEIAGTMAANEPVFAALGALPAGLGPLFQTAFAGKVADVLGAGIDQRAARISQLPFPAPPSNDELLARYQVPDDPDGMTSLFGNTMTVAEKNAYLALWPWDLFSAKDDHDTAITGGQNAFPGVGRPGDQDNHRDAYRHAYWNALMTRDLGAENATELATTHEGNPDTNPDGRDPARESMDLYNNEVGRQIALDNPDLDDVQLGQKIDEAVRGGRMVVMDPNGRLVPSNSVDF